MSLTRRDALKLAAAAAATPLLPRGMAEAEGLAATLGPSVAKPLAGRFFSAPEMALLDELAEMIIPADTHSGGARAAGVAGYIDGRLAEYDPAIPDLEADRERWKAGLATVDALARETSGKTFLETTAAERLALLERLAKPVEDGFFGLLKSWTARGYYTSKVGIHDEMEYKGNRAIVEFAGIDPATLPPVPRTED